MKIIFTTMLLAFIVNLSVAQFTLVKDFNATTASTFTYSSYDGFLAKLGTKVFVRYDTTNTVPATETLLSTLDASGNREKIISVPSHDDSFGPTFFDFRSVGGVAMAFVAISGSDYKIVVTNGTTAGTQVLYTSADPIIGIEAITSGLFITKKKASSTTYELATINTTTGAVTNIKDFGSLYSISDISKTDANTLVFMASDPSDSDKLKLYSSDGTAVGTTAVKEIYTGSGVSQQTVMTQVGSKVFFFYKESGTDCCNYLWVTDGTTGGTTKLTQFNMVPFIDYELSGSAIAWNNKFYFMAVANAGNINNDKVLYVSDGTLAGTIALNTTSTFVKPRALTSFNSKLYFIGYDVNTYNDRLYTTDGTMAGTAVVALKYDANTIYAYDLATDGTNLFMAGYCSGYGGEIFRYNGTDLECAISEGIASNATADPKNLYTNGSSLYFTADIAATGREVYTAGTFTTAGTTSVHKESSIVVSVFPNPSNTMVEVRTEKQVSQLVLMNGQGKELSTTNASSISVQEYPAGVYCLKVIFEDRTSVFSKVVISE